MNISRLSNFQVVQILKTCFCKFNLKPILAIEIQCALRVFRRSLNAPSFGDLFEVRLIRSQSNLRELPIWSVFTRCSNFVCLQIRSSELSIFFQSVLRSVGFVESLHRRVERTDRVNRRVIKNSNITRQIPVPRFN